MNESKCLTCKHGLIRRIIQDFKYDEAWIHNDIRCKIVPLDQPELDMVEWCTEYKEKKND